ncbi:MAG: hypothetical protein WA893_24110, partial [Xanthobacteraceae bacterium]
MAKRERKRRPAAGRDEDVPGLAARRVAADMLDGVLRRRRALDELIDSTAELAALEERDRAL